MSLWVAVQQQQRRSVAADTRENAAATGRDPFRSESREKIGEFCHGCSKASGRVGRAVFSLRPV
jgi:hypothetical protein